MIINIFLFIIFIPNLSHAKSWPKEMYTIEKIFNEQFSSMRRYIKNLKLNYPYEKTENKLIFFSNDSEIRKPIFILKVMRTLAQNHIKEMIVFSTPFYEDEKFIFDRWGNDLRPLSLEHLTSFTFSFPARINSFRLEFQNSQISQEVIMTHDRIESHYRLYDYSLEIHHYEQRETNRLISKLWYQCDVCSGEPLIAMMDLWDLHEGNMSYMLGHPLINVTPIEFFKKANQSYLSGIDREFKSIPNLARKMFGWPAD